MRLDDLAYDWYARRLRRRLTGRRLPRHISLIMDGNRRWAFREIDLLRGFARRENR